MYSLRMLHHLTGIALEITVIRRYRPYKAEMLEIVRAVTGVSVLEILTFPNAQMGSERDVKATADELVTEIVARLTKLSPNMT